MLKTTMNAKWELRRQSGLERLIGEVVMWRSLRLERLRGERWKWKDRGQN